MLLVGQAPLDTNESMDSGLWAMVSGLLARCPFFSIVPHAFPVTVHRRTCLKESAASTRFAFGLSMAVAVAAGGLLVTSSRAVHPWQGFGNS